MTLFDKARDFKYRLNLVVGAELFKLINQYILFHNDNFDEIETLTRDTKYDDFLAVAEAFRNSRNGHCRGHLVEAIEILLKSEKST